MEVLLQERKLRENTSVLDWTRLIN